VEDRLTQTHTDIQIYIDRQRKIHTHYTDTHRHRHIDRQINRETDLEDWLKGNIGRSEM